MRIQTRDKMYRTLPLPVLQSVMPLIARHESPFRPHIIAREVIFIHVPKAAGTSLKTELYGKATGGHRRIVEYYAYDKAKASTYFKCAFVRNPWDRMFSAWSYLSQGVGTSVNDKKFAASVLRHRPEFGDFVRGLDEPDYRKLVLGYGHFRPQTYWLCMPGKSEVAVDFLGRFESIDTDTERMWSALRMATSDRTHPSAKQGADGGGLIRARASQHGNYRDAFDVRTRNIAASIYADDIKILGYSF